MRACKTWGDDTRKHSADFFRFGTQIKTLLNKSPDSLWPFDHDDDGGQAHHHQVPATVIGQQFAHQEKISIPKIGPSMEPMPPMTGILCHWHCSNGIFTEGAAG